MEAQVINASPKEVNLSIKESDIAILYIIQHELLQGSDIDFAGVIVKHPLTNECWMRVTSNKDDPFKELAKAADSALKNVEELNKLFNSKIKGN